MMICPLGLLEKTVLKGYTSPQKETKKQKLVTRTNESRWPGIMWSHFRIKHEAKQNKYDTARQIIGEGRSNPPLGYQDMDRGNCDSAAIVCPLFGESVATVARDVDTTQRDNWRSSCCTNHGFSWSQRTNHHRQHSARPSPKNTLLGLCKHKQRTGLKHPRLCELARFTIFFYFFFNEARITVSPSESGFALTHETSYPRQSPPRL